MSTALTTEQIELLRRLPHFESYRPLDEEVPVLIAMEPELVGFDGEAVFRTAAAGVLLATLDAGAKPNKPTPPTKDSRSQEGLAAELVHESIRNIESTLMEVDQIENEVGGGIAGLRQAYGVQLGTLNTLRQDLIVIAGEIAANQSTKDGKDNG